MDLEVGHVAGQKKI